MSARVFNPMVMTEMRRMLIAGATENGQHAAVADIARVRKNLFGCVDHEESKRFVESELAAQLKRDADLYEFDFVRGVPYSNSKRYVWERVVDKVPEPYALRRLPFLRDHASATESSAAVLEEKAPETQLEQVSESAERRVATVKTKQSSICDFMKSRKRPSNGSSSAATAKLSSTEHTASKQAKKTHS